MELKHHTVHSGFGRGADDQYVFAGKRADRLDGDAGGGNFTRTTGVSFNGTPATTVSGISDTQYNAKVPSGATSGLIT